jgi:hypothetical protein
MCFGSSNPKVASGADNHDQSHTAISYNLDDQLYPNKPVESSRDDFGANTKYANEAVRDPTSVAQTKKKNTYVAPYSAF